MNFDFTLLPLKERISLQLRQLYQQSGYCQYHMSRFEEYGLYQENRRFLASEQVITFTDLDGRLLALKPDVTLSIAKSAQPAPGQCEKYYYSENVYRPSFASHTFEEISQMGLECIGAVDGDANAQVVALALDSLHAAEADSVLEVGHMGFAAGLLAALGAPEEACPRLLEAVRDKNAPELRALAARWQLEAEPLCALLRLEGSLAEVLSQAAALVRNDTMQAALDELSELQRTLASAGKAADLRLDLSLVNDMDYYNGLIFQGFLAGLPRAVLRGGRYDPLADKFAPGARAIGFALYLDEIEQLSAPTPPVETDAPADQVMLNVALPKGRLGDKMYALLEKAGYGCAENYNESRKLVVENPAAGIRYFLVKPSDVAIYVEHGAADVGLVGKDILTESGADVYELLDTRLGRCRMCVAAPVGFVDDTSRALRVATKFVSIAKEYYAAQGREIDIIHLNGSIELAPILGLSDVIVDIVETGATLKENHLQVVTEFMPISARLIANKASYKFKHSAMQTLLQKLEGGLFTS